MAFQWLPPASPWIKKGTREGGADSGRRVSKLQLRTIVSLFSVTPSVSLCLAAASLLPAQTENNIPRLD